MGCDRKLTNDIVNHGKITYDKHTYTDGICSVCGGKGCVIGDLDHTYANGVCSLCGVKGCAIGELEHTYANGVCSLCDYHCPHETWDNGVCTLCAYVCTHDGDKCDTCGKELHSLGSGGIGSVLSEGSLTVVVGIICLIVGAIGMYLIMKKKKTVLADGIESENGE